MNTFHFHSSSLKETIQLGHSLAQLVSPGMVFALNGPLGVGKTHFVKGVIQGLGLKQDVLSPTFSLVHLYQGKISVLHADFYRLEFDIEPNFLGIEETIEEKRAVLLIEWPTQEYLNRFSQVGQINFGYVQDTQPARSIEAFSSDHKIMQVFSQLKISD